MKDLAGSSVRSDEGPDLHPDPKVETLDVLIEHTRALYEIYNERRRGAELRAAALVTAAVAVATLIVTAETSGTGNKHEVLALIVLIALAASGVLAIYGRLGAGVKWDEAWRRRKIKRNRTTSSQTDQMRLILKRPELISTESDRYWLAQDALRQCGSMTDGVQVRERALELWRARVEDAHDAASDKEKWVGAAAAAFTAALICGAVLTWLLVAG
jgi:hypothetical protein